MTEGTRSAAIVWDTRYPTVLIWGAPDRIVGPIVHVVDGATQEALREGLAAAKWAARDPHVAGIVFCGAFARSPMPWAALGASMPSLAQFLGAAVMAPMAIASADPARRRWGEALAGALRALGPDVIAERLRIIALTDVRPELRMLRIPIVVAQFDDDLVIGSRARDELEESCPGAEVIRIPGPHFAIETRPRETAAAILPRIAPWFARPREAA